MYTDAILENVSIAEEEKDPRRAVQQLCQAIRMLVQAIEDDEERRVEEAMGDDL